MSGPAVDGLEEFGSRLVEPLGGLVVAERGGERIELFGAEPAQRKLSALGKDFSFS